MIIGLNPASDDVDTIIRLEQLLQSVVERLQLPTRFCVLSDIVKQTTARSQTRVDVGFQSLAGTSKAISGMVGLDVDGLLALARGFDGLYFESRSLDTLRDEGARKIAALAERGFDRWKKSRGWLIEYSPNGVRGSRSDAFLKFRTRFAGQPLSTIMSL